MFELKSIILTLERIERRQRMILDKLDQLSERPKEEISGPPNDRWLQEGMSNIMAFQAGQKRSDQK